MIRFFTLLAVFLFSVQLFSQTTGDVAIIGANYDDPDEILFVTFVDIPASTDIYITDATWDGSAWAPGGAADGWLKYTTPAEGLAAGDVIKITFYSSTHITATAGTAVSDGGTFNLIKSGSTGDELYLYLGTDKDTPTTFLFAVTSSSAWGADELTNTGLTEGDNALLLCNTCDNLVYNGARTGTTSELKTAIADVSTNWGGSNSRITFSTSRFNITGFVQKPTSLKIENVTSTRIRISWAKPLGTYGTDWNGVTIFVRGNSGNNGNVASTDGDSYAGNLSYGSGTAFGNGFTMVNQTTDSDGDIIITNLTPGTTYYIVAYAYQTISGTNNDEWSNATIELYDKAEVQGVSNLDEYPATGLVDLSWDNNPAALNVWWDEVMILAKANSEVDATPAGDGSAYTADAAFGSGTEIGAGNYVVYKGTGTSQRVTALTNGTTYYFRVFVRYGSDWTDADQYKSISSTPVQTIEDPSSGDLIITEVNDVLASNAAYMELYNNTSSAIKLDSVKIEYYTLGHSVPDYVKELGKVILPSGEYYTIAQTVESFNVKYGKDPDMEFTHLYANSDRDGISIRSRTNGIIDKFNSVPGTSDSRNVNHLYERVNYPNNGSDLTGHWNDAGYNKNGTPGAANDNPLPVELTTFTASVGDEGVVINWRTATEVNNYGFQVERQKVKGESEWENIGFVEGHGNSNSPKSYSFIDTDNKLTGIVKYRLKQIDIDGHFEYSVILEVNIEPNLPKKFTLQQNYPNPFNPASTIKYSLPSVGTGQSAIGGLSLHKVTLTVYDIAGRKVAELVNKAQNPGSYSVKFNAVNLPSGVYFYTLRAGNFSATKKMILMK